MSVEVSARLAMVPGLAADQITVLVQELVTRVDTIMREEHLAPAHGRMVLALSAECVGIEDR